MGRGRGRNRKQTNKQDNLMQWGVLARYTSGRLDGWLGQGIVHRGGGVGQKGISE